MISIIVPVYNTPIKYVEECLYSVTHQTHKDSSELIVFDDGSTYEYKQELKKLLCDIKQATKLIYAETSENRGMAYARNSCAELAQQDYLLFLDSDDVLMPDIIEKVSKVEADNSVFIYTNHALVDENNHKTIHVRDKRIYQKLLTEYQNTVFDPMLHSTFIFHCQIINRYAFKEIGGLRTDLGYGDEVDMHLKVSELYSNQSFQLIPETLYLYRKNPFSVVHQKHLYKKLIENIENILVETAKRRGFKIKNATRIGRAYPTNAAHYKLNYDDDTNVDLPYFDYETCSIKSDLFL